MAKKKEIIRTHPRTHSATKKSAFIWEGAYPVPPRRSAAAGAGDGETAEEVVTEGISTVIIVAILIALVNRHRRRRLLLQSGGILVAGVADRSHLYLMKTRDFMSTNNAGWLESERPLYPWTLEVEEEEEEEGAVMA